MTVKELRKIALKLNLKPARLKKADLIRMIQSAEGNFACFGTATNYCDQVNCLFRKDCLS